MLSFCSNTTRQRSNSSGGAASPRAASHEHQCPRCAWSWSEALRPCGRAVCQSCCRIVPLSRCRQAALLPVKTATVTVMRTRARQRHLPRKRESNNQPKSTKAAHSPPCALSCSASDVDLVRFLRMTAAALSRSVWRHGTMVAAVQQGAMQAVSNMMLCFDRCVAGVY